MFKLAIFAGTTEGRQLAEECGRLNGVRTAVFTATEYGGELLPESVEVRVGRLNAEQMTEVLSGFALAVDATHPYAAEATENIRTACNKTGTEYVRLLRGCCEIVGESVQSMDELVGLLGSCDGTVLSVLGSKSLEALSEVKNAYDRLWLRLLPAETIAERCRQLGFDVNKLIIEKPPFTVEQNIEHLKRSGAGIMLTKESGVIGGYPEKAQAAKLLGVRMITLAHKREQGMSYDDVLQMIRRAVE